MIFCIVLGAILLKFFYAAMLGVLIAAPIGPVSVLCIRYSLKQSFAAGCIVGIGAATGDVIYSVIASVGVDIINDTMAWLENVIKIIGGIFLIILSIYAIRKERAFNFESDDQAQVHDSHRYIFIISFFTTVLSPMTIMLFISMFSAIDLSLNDTAEYIVVPLGIFAGTISWMVAMALLLQYIRHRINHKTAYYINLISNCSIAGFGLVAMCSAIFSYI